MKKIIILSMIVAGCLAAIAEDDDGDAAVKYHYDGCLPVREGSDAVVFTNMTIAPTLWMPPLHALCYRNL